MKIKWLGHACFKITVGNESLVIDPFKDGSVAGYRDIRETANVVLCSHMHGDHFGAETVTLEETKEDPFKIEYLDSFHDDKQGAQRGKNIIHIIEAEGYKIAHLGDLGHRLSQHQIDMLQDLDVLMIPVGGYFTIGPMIARDIVNQLKPRVTIPMHYKLENAGYDVLKTVFDFTKYFENTIYLTDDTLELSDELQNEVIVLDYPENN